MGKEKIRSGWELVFWGHWFATPNWWGELQKNFEKKKRTLPRRPRILPSHRPCLKARLKARLNSTSQHRGMQAALKVEHFNYLRRKAVPHRYRPLLELRLNSNLHKDMAPIFKREHSHYQHPKVVVHFQSQQLKILMFRSQQSKPLFMLQRNLHSCTDLVSKLQWLVRTV